MPNKANTRLLLTDDDASAASDLHPMVVLVDAYDKHIGSMDKLRAHEAGLLHRAFSIFILRYQRQPELLLQQRAAHKYHSGGLWSNACCSHPRPTEPLMLAAHNRLQVECGISTVLSHIGSFTYYAQVGAELSEHEYDHVLIGQYHQEFVPSNPEEIQATRWVSFPALEDELNNHPYHFTAWLAPAFAIVKQHLKIVGNHCK